MNKKKAGKFLLKITLSLVILVYLFSQVSLSSLAESFWGARHHYIILAFGLYLVGQVLSTYKWGLLVNVLGFQRGFKKLLAYYFIGMFFNLFLLGSIGGDVGRVYLLAGRSESRARAGYSILAERFTGGLALATIATVALISSLGKEVIPFWLRIGMIGGCAAVWAIVFTLPLFVKLLPWLTKWAQRINLGDFTIYWSYPRRMSLVLAISFIFQVLNVLVFASIGTSLDLGVPLGYYFVIVPIVDLISILPISINGMGVREGSYVYFLHLMGVETSRGLAFGLLGLLVVVASSLLGGMVYVLGDYPLHIRRRGGI
ncbi:MAG: hypothetical protein DRG50_04945 [Deltaproteobacteria bacterium]|nr:MAG: hypothetical protein DRG50_04945 [Deltaproteobacteria bacterium]